MRKRIISLLLAVLMLLSLVGCGKIRIHTDDGSFLPHIEPEETASAEETYSNPLTGEQTETDLSGQRPFAVMVNNISVAQPQVGISVADWIYEVEAEGGITRMMALYTGIQNASTIGSIRSLRPYYLSLAMCYDAIMIHAGGSEDAYSDCMTYQWDHLDGVRDPVASSTIFYRDPNRTAYGTEHSLFLYPDKVFDMADQYGFRRVHNEGYQTGLTFSDDSVSLCSGEAGTVEITLSQSKKTSFFYHADSGTYSGVQYGGDYIDGATGIPVPFSNLLVLFTRVVNSNDEYGHITVDTVGSGTGYFFTGGKATAINWSRDGINSPFRYTLQDGTPLTLTLGKTYCAFVSADYGRADFS